MLSDLLQFHTVCILYGLPLPLVIPTAICIYIRTIQSCLLRHVHVGKYVHEHVGVHAFGHARICANTAMICPASSRDVPRPHVHLNGHDIITCTCTNIAHGAIYGRTVSNIQKRKGMGTARVSVCICRLTAKLT